MKVDNQNIAEVGQPKREVNVDKLVQAQVEKVKLAEQQLAFEQGKLRMLLELITPQETVMAQSEATIVQ